MRPCLDGFCKLRKLFSSVSEDPERGARFLDQFFRCGFEELRRREPILRESRHRVRVDYTRFSAVSAVEPVFPHSILKGPAEAFMMGGVKVEDRG